MKLFLITLLITLSLSATENVAKYGISMKMLGHIGESSLTMHTSGKQYEMKMHLQMDKSLSDVEHRYESYGTVVDGIYKPARFVKYIREDDREETNYYLFDYEKRVIEKYTTIKEKRSMLGSLFASKENEYITTETFELMTNFTQDDTLTTFLNAEHLLNGKKEMVVESVGFRKDERNILLYRTADAYAISIVDKEADDDYSILISIAPDGLVSKIAIQEYTFMGTIHVARD